MRGSDLVIVTTEPFPAGMAATNRTISYARQLADRKDVLVLIPVPTERPHGVRNSFATGSIGNLYFEYTGGRTTWPVTNLRLLKLFFLIKGYIGLILRLMKIRPKVVNIYTSRPYIRWTLLAMSKIMGFGLLCEEDEYPKVLRTAKSSMKLRMELGFYKKCDGMIVMTKELEGYYSSIGAASTFRLPMTVDYERFSKSFERPPVGFSGYFVYVGGGGGFERDGVANIVESFSIFSARRPGYKLLIIGPVDRGIPECQRMLKIIEENSLLDQVVFTGPVSSDEIPAYLNNAMGIVMTPQHDYSSGGFPTKLGEFLASGRPVVTTAVSEIPDYLNTSNSFIVPAGNCHLVAEQMIKVVDNPLQADEIGEKGRDVAFENFRADLYIDDLIVFMGL